MSEVSRILSAIDAGDPHAAGQLMPLVYDELRRLAAGQLARERPGQTLSPTALVHEAYLRLVGPAHELHFVNRRHFFAAAAELVKLLYFAGLTVDQAAATLGISPRTAARNGAYARAWLYRRLTKE
jgi:DNA-directed RNA polymerase specialized sigma24 family protein